MARTVIEETSSPAYVEDDGPGLGLVIGVLLGIALVVLAVLFFTGTFDRDSTTNIIVPDTGPNQPNASAPAEPSSEPSALSTPAAP
jgi:hypothetical protein